MSGASDFFARARGELYSAVIGDVLDALGRRQQFLPPDVRPLRDDMVIVGRAMPVLAVDETRSPDEMQQEPFGQMLRALDDLAADEVYVATAGTQPCAAWGELMTICARNRGAAGVVLDGFARDTRGILALGFPCFCRGRYAQDQRTRGTVVDFRVPIRIGDADIHPGDILFGDLDGVVVVPREMEEEVFARAWEKARGERRVFDAITRGMGARAAWETFGIF